MSRFPRIDYKKLNSTGERVPISEEPITALTEEQIATKLQNLSLTDSTKPIIPIKMADPSEQAIELMVIAETITDTINESLVNIMVPDQVADVINNVNKLRSDLRRTKIKIKISKEILPGEFTEAVEVAEKSILDFNKAIQEFKTEIYNSNKKTHSDETTRKEETVQFLLGCVNQSINEMEQIFQRDTLNADSNTLLTWRTEVSSINTSHKKIQDQYKQCLETPVSSTALLTKIKETKESYMKLDTLKQVYNQRLTKEIGDRELDKLADFKKSSLNIKLEKFTGYDSIDFFTFKTNFEKMHVSSTPTHLLPDLLKNNYLAGPALSMVKSNESIDSIWERLKEAFGNPRVMLSRKLQQIETIEFQRRDSKKLTSTLSKTISIMKELSELAEKHHIEEYLYYGDTMGRINQIIGEGRSTRFISSICDESLNPKETWHKMITFLTKERKVHEQKQLMSMKPEPSKREDSRPSGNRRSDQLSHHSTNQPSTSDPICTICNAGEGVDEHISTSGPKASRIFQYYTCKEFATKPPAERLRILINKGFCTQCLFPGANASTGKHLEGRCQRDFVCPHQSHQYERVRNHVMLCEDHKALPSNQQLLQRYVERFMKNPRLPAFARQIHLYKASSDQFNDRGIYLLQRIRINNNDLVIFYDNGCSDFVVSHKAIQLLGPHATQLSSHPVTIGGVGNTQTHSTRGVYNVKIPLHDGTEASFSGVCLEKITETFPTYPLAEVEKDINQHYYSTNHSGKLPKLPSSVGGDVHLMIGIKYLRYHPSMKFQLQSGLAIYESKFVNSTGGRGVVGGPHPIFTTIHQNFTSTMSTFFSNELNTIRTQHQDTPLIGFKQQPYQQTHTEVHLSTAMRVFEDVESAGSEISYRCPKCRECKDCKHDINETISIKEEVEQTIINKSVTIDFDNGITKALLPFTADPTKRLSNNREKAMKVFQQQIRKLNNPKNHKDKQDILDSEGKLQQLGYVDYVKNLPLETQAKLQNSEIHYHIPWRAVWKGNSISTPCRIVFDASQPTSTGFSLNDILAKGTNNLNKLQEILLKWTIQPVAIATDIRKMYNTIKLEEDHWTYQRYLWHPNLETGQEPEEKVIKTLIYGVKSSGNQAEYALRQVADLSKSEFPRINEIVHKDVYVDDCLTGESNRQEAHHRSDELEVVLNRGGFQVKGVAFSGEEPPSSLSEDNKTIFVAGMKWFVKEDMLSLNVGELNFAKKNRGKKPSHLQNIIPTQLTRRHCASKVAELFDLSGKVAPLIASMKIDLQDLIRHQLDWDDQIPNNLRPLWESNFELIKEIGQLKFKRAIVPEDAVNLDMDTIDFGDASQSMACVAIYARFMRRNGEYSCQLLFSRTRTIKDLTQPRAELYAALINCHTGEIVRRSISKWHRSSIKLTDSQIVLHWINNDEKPLKKYVRSRIVEIKRFTSKSQWNYVDTSNMLADIGTRRGTPIHEVNKDSKWINGYEWMHHDQSTFPIKSAENLKLNQSEMEEIQKETQIQTHHADCFPLKELEERYEFSSYLLDPNYRSFTNVVRIMAYAIRFCNRLLHKKTSTSISNVLIDEEITSAERYYFRKATEELRQFVQPKKYETITTAKDDILLYNGRILPNNSVTIVGRYTEAMLDLTSSTFCVPVIDKNSPVAFSIASDVHWNHNDVKHAGIETTLRHIMKKVYIIEGRSLVKSIKKSCQRCRFLNKRTIEAAMGPLPESSITIAPSFYNTQLDLSGPYKAYSPLHKRTTVKVWLVVYCCCVTSAVSINVMDDYSSTAFIQSFTRFATRYGFPRKVFCDEGTQLVKGTKDMRLNFKDIRSKLHKDHQVTVETCPVGAHNMNGKVERKIREINQSLEKSIQNERLSILQWETICAVISNSINDLPIAIRSVIDVENMDLLTPNRLLLGRNNDRSPTGDLVISTDPTKLLNQSSKVYDAWFESWLMNHVPKLMTQSKWFDHQRNLQVGDVVLFNKVDSKLSRSYTYGIISSVEVGDDDKVRCVIVKYRNENEKVLRETRRSVRNLVLIHSVDDCDIMKDLGDIAKNVDLKFKLNI